MRKIMRINDQHIFKSKNDTCIVRKYFSIRQKINNCACIYKYIPYVFGELITRGKLLVYFFCKRFG